MKIELERVKKEALLADGEIRKANIRVLKRHGIELPQTLQGYLGIPEEERLGIIEEQEQERVNAQIDKFLNTSLGNLTLKELIELYLNEKLAKVADNQSLPTVDWRESRQDTIIEIFREAGCKKVELLKP